MEPISADKLQKYNEGRTHDASLFCYAPFRNMFFTRSGIVNACGWNKSHALGKYPDQTVRQMWEGPAAQKLRDKIASNDLSEGCNICYNYLTGGNLSNIKSKYYDYLSEKVEHNYPLRMDFELSNVCNVECTTCFGDLSSSIRKNRENLPPFAQVYNSDFVEQLKEFIPHLRVATFLGGEPFLVNIYYDIWEQFAALNPQASLAVTTNGTIWNNKVRDILNRCNFDITVSRDCMDNEKLERLRKNTNGATQLVNIDHFNEYSKKHGRPMRLNAVLSTLNWMDLPDVARYCNSLEASLYICTVIFPFKYSVRSLSKDELLKAEAFFLEEIEKLPEGSPIEKKNKQAIEGALNHVRFAKANLDADSTKATVSHIRFMDEIGRYAVSMGADEQATRNKFEKAMLAVKERNPAQYEQLLRSVQQKDFEMALSQVIWREEDHLHDYLPEYIVAG